jgi:hypothetical protein
VGKQLPRRTTAFELSVRAIEVPVLADSCPMRSNPGFDPFLAVTNDRYTSPYLSLISSLVMVRSFGGPPPCISLRGKVFSQ